MAQPDPPRLSGHLQAAQAGKRDAAVADRDVEFERDTCADCAGGRRAGQVGEVRGRALVEVYQAIVQPSA
jgi:hypothetical protein